MIIVIAFIITHISLYMGRNPLPLNYSQDSEIIISTSQKSLVEVHKYIFIWNYCLLCINAILYIVVDLQASMQVYASIDHQQAQARKLVKVDTIISTNSQVVGYQSWQKIWYQYRIKQIQIHRSHTDIIESTKLLFWMHHNINPAVKPRTGSSMNMELVSVSIY